MPIPTAYSEASLAAFMAVELAGIGTALGWVAGSPSIAEAVADVELALGVSDVVTSSTKVAVIRALACLYAWRRARGALAVAYDFSTDGQSLKREQMWQHADEMVAYYELEVSALPGGFGMGSVWVDVVVRSEDPYAVAASGAEF